MAKKKNSRTGQGEKPVPVQPRSKGPFVSEPVPGNIAMNIPIHPVSLVIGSWKKNFSEQQYKIIIAQALNDCIRKGILIVGGYLITNRRLLLVLVREVDILPTLLLFYDSVKKEIRQHLEWIKKNNKIPGDRGWLINIDESYSDLFIPHPLFNDPLIRLITGRQVRLGYYDPHLARLKDRVLNNNFCSARDYTGAKGPVYVKLITDEDWAAEYRRIHKERHKGIEEE